MQKASHLLMKETEDGQLIVSSEVLKRIFGVTQRLISDWAMQGCPKYDRGWWNLKDVIEWRGLGRQKGEKKSDEAKKLEADADLKYAKARQEELKLAEMMGELIPKERTKPHWGHITLLLLKSGFSLKWSQITVLLQRMQKRTYGRS